MKMIIEVENQMGDWSAKLMTPDKVVVEEVFGMSKHVTLACAANFVSVAGEIL